MSEKEIRDQIAELIIEIEKPFSLEGLFFACKRRGISDQELILEVLEDLCDSGIIGYSEVQDQCWAYVPCG